MWMNYRIKLYMGSGDPNTDSYAALTVILFIEPSPRCDTPKISYLKVGQAAEIS